MDKKQSSIPIDCLNVGVQCPDCASVSVGSFENKSIQTEEVCNIIITFNFCLLNIYLTKQGLRLLENIDKNKSSICIQGYFMEKYFESNLMPIKEDIPLNFKYKYTINSPKLVHEISKQPVNLKICLFQREGSETSVIASGTILFVEIFKYPHNKIYSNIPLWINSNSENKLLFGSLLFWYALDSENDTLESFLLATKYDFTSQETLIDSELVQNNTSTTENSTSTFIPSINLFRLDKTDESKFTSDVAGTSYQISKAHGSKHDASMNERQISLSPTKTSSFSTFKDLISTRDNLLTVPPELNKRINWLFEEANWKRTIQEYAILNGLDPYDLEWAQLYDKTHLILLPRKFVPLNNVPRVFTIIIHSVILFQNSSIMKNPNFYQFYVEYSFLDFEGEDMETLFTLPKPSNENEPLVFNFEKKFYFDEANLINCEILAKKVRGKDSFTFFLISEPHEIEEYSECEEVAMVQIRYYDLCDAEEDIKEKNFPLKDITNSDDVGIMKLSFLGVHVIRQVALEHLTPHGFKFAISF